MTVSCENCYKEFFQPFAWYKRSKTHSCSKECTSQLRIKKSTKFCQYCNRSFYSKFHQKEKQFCSNNCRSKSQRKRVNKTCEECGIKYDTVPSRKSSKFCSNSCRRNNWIKTRVILYGKDNPSWKGYKEIKRDKSKFRKWSLEVKKQDKFICQVCSSKINLCSHHVLPVKDFPELKFKTFNGITLCKKCHAKEHEQDEKRVSHLILS